jgi:Domain of unknown function (DUF4269)
MHRQSYEDALAECGVLEVLAPFDPRVAGTPPLGLDLPGSDIDVLCFAPSACVFTDIVWHAFSDAPAFLAKQWVDPPNPWLSPSRRLVGKSNSTAKRSRLSGNAVGATSPLNGDCSRLAGKTSERLCSPCGSAA